MNAVNNTTARLDADTLDRLKKAIRLRKSKGILIKHVSEEMGYVNLSSAGDVEAMRYNYGHERVEQYIRAVNKLARNPSRSGVNIGSAYMRVSAPVSDDLMAEFRRCMNARKSAGVNVSPIAHEMTTLLTPLGYRVVSDRMVYHFERTRHLDPDRAKAYIAAVEKLCASPQISITIPAPVEPPPEPPAVIPVAAKAPNRSDFVPLAALLILAEYAEDSDLYRMELKLRRVGLATMIGRDDQAAWDAAVASAASVTVSSLLSK
jgi:hypothetical protein